MPPAKKVNNVITQIHYYRSYICSPKNFLFYIYNQKSKTGGNAAREVIFYNFDKSKNSSRYARVFIHISLKSE